MKKLLLPSYKTIYSFQIFFKKFIILLFEHNKINYYIVSLKKDKHLYFKPINSLKVVKLEIPKIFINIR